MPWKAELERKHSELILSRAESLLQENQSALYRRTDRLFAYLMILQWIAGIVAAFWISPRTWAGTSSEPHLHVWAAVFLGGGIIALPLYLTFMRPGSRLTRHVIAVAQMLTSALLIHLSGGRIETHFHVFGSLAFLACYRDWRVLVSATVVVVADHFVRGIYYPQSAFGVITSSPWRIFEHAAWVMFEDVFLIIATHQSNQEAKDLAHQQAKIEVTNKFVEKEVKRRTEELQSANDLLSRAKSHLEHQAQELERQAPALLEAQQKMEDANEEFHAVLASTLDPMLTVDTYGTIRSASDSVEAVFGWSPQELVGENIRLLMPESVSSQHDHYLAKYRESGKTYILGQTREMEAMRRDGSLFPCELSVSLVPGSAKREPLLTGIIRDVTGRKQVEKRVEELARFPDENTNPLLRVTQAGKLVYANAASKDLLKHWTCQPGETVPPTVIRCIDQALAVNKNKVMEVTCQEKTYSLIITPIKEYNYTNIYSQDITTRRKAEESLLRSRRAAEVANGAKSEFLANMSHEIRTPMTAILGFADMLLGGTLDEERLDAVNTIKRNGEHLLSIINNILDLSKIESGKLRVESIPCSPHQIVAEVVSLMRVRASAQPISLNVEFVGSIPETIECDPTRLRQVLINLVGNAIKFTETGSVRVVTRLLQRPGNPPQLQIDVIDTGIGMTEEQQEHLFEPFVQADTSTTRRFGGSGLGLTISKRLTELLGGSIQVASSPGTGSTFSVTVGTGSIEGVRLIDRAAESLQVEPEEIKTDRGHRSLNCRILLAEDGPDNQRLISLVLKKAGAKVTVAENGLVAKQLALEEQSQDKPFDVILMDMQMPVLDGYDATRQLRAEGYTGPIIALTAHAMAGDCEKCLAAGCDDYDTKPINRERLIETVSKYLRLPADA